MKIPSPLCSLAVLTLASTATLAAADVPIWAYPVAAPGASAIPVAPDDGRPKRVPDSTVALTREQLKAHASEIPDWHPEEHPAMPDIVRKGREPQVWACGYCHLPTGVGRPENASLAGLPVNYIKQQMLAFKNGERPGSEPKRGPQNNMILVAKAASEAEVEAAAIYFAALKPQTFVKVVESATAPKSVVAGTILARAPGGGTEPLGHRIIEVPDELERFEDRDSRTPYIAYVPPGSLKRGADLVNTGSGGKTQVCVTCHGPEMKGLLDVPRLAGRSPSYLLRQLYDVQQGTRTGPSTLLMKAVVANLTLDDMIAISAYLASRDP